MREKHLENRVYIGSARLADSPPTLCVTLARQLPPSLTCNGCPDRRAHESIATSLLLTLQPFCSWCSWCWQAAQREGRSVRRCRW